MKVLPLAACMMVLASSAEARPLRAMSLDQCADQYLLALAPEAVLALSPRADDPDSWLRDASQGRRRLRPTLEAAIGFDPDLVVRTWGGEPRLLSRLARDGAAVVSLADPTDFEGVRLNIRQAARALDRVERGERLIARMDGTLTEAGRRGERRGDALYLTAGGFTAGPGVMIDAILRAAGFRNAATSAGFAPISVERIALRPPARFVLGFFDQARADWRGPGRHPVVRRAATRTKSLSLPTAALTCPAWFAADAAASLASRR